MIFIPFFTSTEGIKKYIGQFQKHIFRSHSVQSAIFCFDHRSSSLIPKIRFLFLSLATVGLIVPTSSAAFSPEEEDIPESLVGEMTLNVQCPHVLNSNEADTPVSEPKLPPTPDAPVRVMKVSATAYSSTPGQTDSSPFITASGQHVRDGIIAANFLPFGTRVRIPDYFGDKEFVVTDRMAPRFESRIDVWFPEYHQAKQFGVKRSVRLEVLD